MDPTTSPFLYLEKVSINLSNMTARYHGTQDNLLIMKSRENYRRRNPRMISSSTYDDQFDIKKALDNKFLTKAGLLGRNFLKSNNEKNPSIRQVIQGLKKHYINKVSKIKDIQWDSQIVLQQ